MVRPEDFSASLGPFSELQLNCLRQIAGKESRLGRPGRQRVLVIVIGVEIARSHPKFILSACEQSLPDRKVELQSVSDHLADLALRACD